MADSQDPLILGVYVAAVVVLIAAMIGLSWMLGSTRTGRAMVQPFESGMLPVGNARLRLSIQYYLVAMFFVVFDMEAVFVLAWALVVRRAGWTGYATMLVFIGVLLAAFVYLWRAGALDWGPRPRRSRLQGRASPALAVRGGR